ncbi:hypothetical protein NECID01_0366 [Nematocida sp. AWRm77]|nr:hypothetical protein NECID01_0366 [Nematocida sp. AWRm77]
MNKCKLEEIFEHINKLVEEIPSTINEHSEILGTDPQTLQISLPLSSKEKVYLKPETDSVYFQKRSKGRFPGKEVRVHTQYYAEEYGMEIEEVERTEEVEEWDIKIEGKGRFDQNGNYVMDDSAMEQIENTEKDQEPAQEKSKEEPSSTEEDWIMVQDGKSKKKPVHKGKPHIHKPDVQKTGKVSRDRELAGASTSQHPHYSSKKDVSEEHTDNDGFTVVKDRKSKQSSSSKPGNK